MTGLWCVRAGYGKYARSFVEGGYMAIGGMPTVDFSHIQNKEDLYSLYARENPQEKSRYAIGIQVGQIFRFLREIRVGDYVVTPAEYTEWLHYGTVLSDYCCFRPDDDGCSYPHRRRVKWSRTILRRRDFSTPFQNTLRAMLTVFSISQVEEFLTAINDQADDSREQKTEYDLYRTALPVTL